MITRWHNLDLIHIVILTDLRSSKRVRLIPYIKESKISICKTGYKERLELMQSHTRAFFFRNTERNHIL